MQKRDDGRLFVQDFSWKANGTLWIAKDLGIEGQPKMKLKIKFCDISVREGVLNLER